MGVFRQAASITRHIMEYGNVIDGQRFNALYVHGFLKKG